MDKYIGNKKSILNEIYTFMISKGIVDGWFIDAFSGTTNVGQYFKQRGFSIVSNDANSMSFVLGMAYIKNNSFPRFKELNKTIFWDVKKDNDDIANDINNLKKKIMNDVIFDSDYWDRTDFEKNIMPLMKVLHYLNGLDIDELTKEESLIFEHYCENGSKSEFVSARGLKGKRNYFTEENAKLLGKIIVKIREWEKQGLLTENEKYILLTCVIEEVTLNANVNGTFHDFNRTKLYPNALAPLHLKPIMLNIYKNTAKYKVVCGDSNELFKEINLKKNDRENATLYIDPPYNFRQYGAYYHFLNFLASIYEIDNLAKYLSEIQYVRGQNMSNNFVSDYCYKDKFITAMKELVESLKCKHIVISYYDENNHWNHGKENISMEGREAIYNMLQQVSGIKSVDRNPYIVERRNYQSQSGAHKKKIDELVFYGMR